MTEWLVNNFLVLCFLNCWHNRTLYHFIRALVASIIQQTIWKQPSSKFFCNVNVSWVFIAFTKDPFCQARIPLHWCDYEESEPNHDQRKHNKEANTPSTTTLPSLVRGTKAPEKKRILLCTLPPSTDIYQLFWTIMKINNHSCILMYLSCLEIQ